MATHDWTRTPTPPPFSLHEAVQRKPYPLFNATEKFRYFFSLVPISEVSPPLAYGVRISSKASAIAVIPKRIPLYVENGTHFSHLLRRCWPGVPCSRDHSPSRCNHACVHRTASRRPASWCWGKTAVHHGCRQFAGEGHRDITPVGRRWLGRSSCHVV